MKPLHLLVLLAILSLISCNRKPDPVSGPDNLEMIENMLLPNIIIEGTDPEGFNNHERMKLYSVPGVSMAFMDQGKIVWAKGYGYTAFDSLKAVDEFTLFQAASISKPVAAMAALYMVEEGQIGLDQDVNQYLKDWQVADIP